MLGALKSLLCFPLDIDVNNTLSYHTNYFLRKCCKKQSQINRTAFARAFVCNFSWNCNKILVTVKNSAGFVKYFYKPQHGITEAPSLQILSNRSAIEGVHHVMKDFHLCGWLLSCNLSKISAKLAISLNHKIMFAKFLEILLENNVTSKLTHIRCRSKNHSEIIWVYSFGFFY